MQPDPKQENSKATVGVEVPEEVAMILSRPTAEALERCSIQTVSGSAEAEGGEQLFAALRTALESGTQDPNVEELNMILLALKNQDIEGVAPERGVEILIERLAAIRNEEREKVLGEVREVIKAEIKRLRDWDSKAVSVTDAHEDTADRLEAALASLPIDAMEEPPVSDEAIAERRSDPEFRARLERSVEENREVLERLEPPDPASISRRALLKLLTYAQSQNELLDGHFAVTEARKALARPDCTDQPAPKEEESADA